MTPEPARLVTPVSRISAATRRLAGLGRTLATWLLVISAGLVATAVLMAVLGIDPLASYLAMINGAVGSPISLGNTVAKAIPVALIALGIAVTFRAGLWNVGGEGQFICGGIVAAVLGIYLDGPAPLVVMAELLGGAFGGLAIALVPALLKIRFGSNEILVTLMLNFVALLLASYVISGPLSALHTTASLPITEAGYLPWFSVADVRTHLGAAIAALAIAAVFLLMRGTTFGFALVATGVNPHAARSVGISTSNLTIQAFAVAGSLAGVAGAIQVAAVHHSLVDGFSQDVGFTAIVAALLGGLTAIGTAVASVGLSALFVAGQAMQRAQGIPVSVVFVIEGVILILLLASRLTDGSLRRG